MKEDKQTNVEIINEYFKDKPLWHELSEAEAKELFEKLKPLAEVRVGDIAKLKDGRIVRITEARDKEKYAYPVWFVDITTGIPDGCKYSDIVSIEVAEVRK